MKHAGRVALGGGGRGIKILTGFFRKKLQQQIMKVVCAEILF
jgi:hypothetical protein